VHPPLLVQACAHRKCGVLACRFGSIEHAGSRHSLLLNYVCPKPLNSARKSWLDKVDSSDELLDGFGLGFVSQLFFQRDKLCKPDRQILVFFHFWFFQRDKLCKPEFFFERQNFATNDWIYGGGLQILSL
jgi:hypothetical protein